MDRSSSQSDQECAFQDAVGVEVGETGYGLIEDPVQLTIINMSVDPVFAVLCRDANGLLVGGLRRNVLDAASLSTHWSLKTVSFCGPARKRN